MHWCMVDTQTELWKLYLFLGVGWNCPLVCKISNTQTLVLSDATDQMNYLSRQSLISGLSLEASLALDKLPAL